MPSAPTLFRRLLVAGALLASQTALWAMSVIPPSFDELVSHADTVVRGVVTDVHCVTVDTPQGTAIKTLVTLHVERALKGTPGEDVTLSFLGGKVGRRTLTVVGMPKFNVGDRELVFIANNGRTICPLIAAGHGRYHVRHDPTKNRDYVARDNEEPLTTVADVSRPLEAHAEDAPAHAAAAPTEALTPEAFEEKIVDAVRTGRRFQQP